MSLSSSYVNPSPLFVAPTPVKKRRDQSGFSLVELSIVLVILGLLTGGILAGQSLIRAAELRSVTTEYQRYSTAVQTFRDKYMAIPGDMPNATRFWGEQHATPATCQTTASTSALTCNGNGDGSISDCGYEMFRLWQHLANAGLVEGSFSGVVGGAGACNHVLGTNAPRSKLSNAGWAYSTLGNYGGDGGTFAANYGTLFWFGAASVDRPQGDILKPEEAWNLDTKMDDGKPAQGSIIVRSELNAYGTSGNCTTAANMNDLAADYRLTNSSAACALMIRQR
ncbi:MAG: hypothetical protein C0436_03330 [Alphaproteobacteria bacterium]|nr:hypothetical protein [Alphaproteobacteria bacterium]